jgi:cell division control protein 6
LWGEGGTVFVDESKLLPEYVPLRIPHREDKLRELILFFRPVVDSPSSASQQVLLTGPVGTGKTLLAKKLGLHLESASPASGRVRVLHVNCRIDRGLPMVVGRALDYAGLNISSRGFSTSELIQILLDTLVSRGLHLVIALDEVDSLVSREGLEVIYALSRLREVARVQCLSTLLISKDLGYLVGIDNSTYSSLQKNVVRLPPYTEGQLYTILRERAAEAFREGAVSDSSLRLAASMAAEQGDARYAIELLYRAGKIVDLRSEGRVLPEHVRLARSSLPPGLRREELQYLDGHEALILLAAAQVLQELGEGEAVMGQVEEYYRRACKRYGVEPLHHTQIWVKVGELKQRGLLDARLSGKGRRGRTTLITTHIPADVLEKEVRAVLEAEVPS